MFLDQTRYDLTSHCAVLGCTLFSRIRPEQIVPVQLFWSDFSNIENWKLEDHNEAHASDVSWVNRQGASIMRQEPSRTIVIFTHHSPTMVSAALHPKYEADAVQVFSGFATDLSTPARP